MFIKNVFKALAAITALAAGVHASVAHAAIAKQCNVPASFQFPITDFPCESADKLQRALGRGSYGSSTSYTHSVKFLAGIGTSAGAAGALLSSNGTRTLATTGLPCTTSGDVVIDASYGTPRVCQLQTAFGVSTLRIAVR
jgi:hypothetical protein